MGYRLKLGRTWRSRFCFRTCQTKGWWLTASVLMMPLKAEGQAGLLQVSGLCLSIPVPRLSSQAHSPSTYRSQVLLHSDSLTSQVCQGCDTNESRACVITSMTHSGKTPSTTAQPLLLRS